MEATYIHTHEAGDETGPAGVIPLYPAARIEVGSPGKGCREWGPPRLESGRGWGERLSWGVRPKRMEKGLPHPC